MNTNIIQWRDPEDLSQGFYIDLEKGSMAEILQIYSKPIEFISAFTDCYLLMSASITDAESAGKELYEKTRSAISEFIDRYRSLPVNHFPAQRTLQ